MELPFWPTFPKKEKAKPQVGPPPPKKEVSPQKTPDPSVPKSGAHSPEVAATESNNDSAGQSGVVTVEEGARERPGELPAGAAAPELSQSGWQEKRETEEYLEKLVKEYDVNTSNEIPPDFCCPLSLEIMVDPVVIESGQTYERVYIEKWFKDRKRTCPKTMQVLAHTNILPNYAVKSFIRAWADKTKYPLPATAVLPDSEDGGGGAGGGGGGSGGGDSRRPSEAISSTFRGRRLDELRKMMVATPAYPSSPSLPSAPAASSPRVGQGEDRRSQSARRTDSSRSGVSSMESGEFPQQPARINSLTHCQYTRQLSSAVSADVAETIFSDEQLEVGPLIALLRDGSEEERVRAAETLRGLSKLSQADRLRIADAGAIPHLIALLHSDSPTAAEHAVTTLLNLAYEREVKARVVEAGAVEPLVGLLQHGSAKGRENAAGALCCLSVSEEYRALIGALGAIPPLVALLESGSTRGKKDATIALFNLAIHAANKTQIVWQGAIQPLVRTLDSPDLGLEDETVALLANLAKSSAAPAVMEKAGAIPALVAVVEGGSARAKADAAAALLVMAQASPAYVELLSSEGARPSLVGLSHTGTNRGKAKAALLLAILRGGTEEAEG